MPIFKGQWEMQKLQKTNDFNPYVFLNTLKNLK